MKAERSEAQTNLTIGLLRRISKVVSIINVCFGSFLATSDLGALKLLSSAISGVERSGGRELSG